MALTPPTRLREKHPDTMTVTLGVPTRTGTQRRRSPIRRLRANLPYILMVAPALILFIIFFITPVARTVSMSFTDQSNHSRDISFVGFENYIDTLTNPQILTGIQNSLVYAVVVVLLQNLIALPIALVLNAKIPFRSGFRSIFFSPAVLSVLVVGYLWSFILSPSPSGLINSGLAALGIPAVNWLGDPHLALWSVMATQVWQWFGYQLVIYLAALQTINPDLYEAAALDGASRWKSFLNVTLPGLVPAFQITIVTGLIAGLNVFDIVFSMTGGGPGYATETVLTLMFRKFSEGNYGYAAAFGVLFLLVAILLTVILLRLFRRLERRYS